MFTYPLAWISAALVFATMDAGWLAVMTPRLYRPLLGEHLNAQLKLAPALVFYLLYITGLVALAVAPALEKRSAATAFVLGGALGLVAYGSYDLTNQATLRGWDVRITLADMAWGAFASAVASLAAYMMVNRVR